jgi:hypothetical protein
MARRLVAEAVAHIYENCGGHVTGVEVVLRSALRISAISVHEQFATAAGTRAQGAHIRVTWGPGRYDCLEFPSHRRPGADRPFGDRTLVPGRRESFALQMNCREKPRQNGAGKPATARVWGRPGPGLTPNPFFQPGATAPHGAPACRRPRHPVSATVQSVTGAYPC